MKIVENPTYGLLLALGWPIIWRSALYSLLVLLLLAIVAGLAQLGEMGVVLVSYASLPAVIFTFPLALRGAMASKTARYRLTVMERE